MKKTELVNKLKELLEMFNMDDPEYVKHVKDRYGRGGEIFEDYNGEINKLYIEAYRRGEITARLTVLLDELEA